MTSLLPLEIHGHDRLPAPDTSRFKPLRSGVQNIWQHDSVLVYRDGRMLNRGVNGTGKSIFLGLQVPFLFDGRQTYAVPPVSTSGARGTLRDLLLDGRKHQSRIGYTWLEFGRQTEHGAEFVTCGAGLRASQSASGVVTWYFVTEHRIGRDVDLFHRDGHPLDAGELRAALGRDHVFDDQSSYRAAVDAGLFGIGQERLRRLTTILRSLSRPNLASNLDAEKAGDFITDFLDPLPDRLFEQIGEHYAKVDALAQRSNALHDHVATMDQLLSEHREYARVVVRTLAHRLRKADSDHRTVSEERREAQGRLDAAEAALANATADAETARMHAAGLEQRVRTLETSDAVRAVQALADVAVQLDKAELRLAAAKNAAGEARAAAAEMQEREADAVQRFEGAAREVERTLRQAVATAAEASLADDHARMEERLATDGRVSVARTRLDATMKRRRQAIDALRRLDVAWRDAQRRSQTLHEVVRQREGDLDDGRGALAEAITRRDDAAAALRSAVGVWVAACIELRADDDGVAALVDAVESRAGLVRAAERLAAPQRDAISSARAHAEQDGREIAVAIAALEAERADIAAERDDGPPTVSGRLRTEGRPGAPLWAVCDFAPHFDEHARASLEAALEAAGLLDAWVLPDGGLLADTDHDAALLVGDDINGPSLADVLVPDGQAVPAATVSAILRRIGLDRLDLPVAVLSDGGYSVGPLRGRAHKTAPEHIGAGARERRRRERIATIDERIAQHRSQAAAVELRVVELRQRAAALSADLAGVPDEAPLRETDAAIAPARAAVETATARLENAREKHEQATQAEAAAHHDLTRTALENGLTAWLDDLGAIAAHSDAYERAAWSWLTALEERERAARDLDRQRGDTVQAQRRVAEHLTTEGAARLDVNEQLERHAALKEVAGTEAEEVMRLLEGARRDRDAAAASATRAAHDREQAGNRRVEMQVKLEGLGARFDDCAAARDVAADAFRTAVAAGMLECSGWPALRDVSEVPVEEAGVRRLLVLARADQMGERPPPPESLGRRQNEVIALLPTVFAKLIDYRPALIGEENDPAYHIPVAEYRGEARPLLEIRDLVSGDAQWNDDLIDAEERRFFDDVMLSEVTTQLNDVLRAAEEQIERINACVLERPTRRGHRVRLHWGLKHGEVPEGTRDALELVAQHPRLQDDDGRRALTRWLRERVAEAREGEDGPLQDRLARSFDYRVWHRVEVQLRPPESTAWERFNSKRAVLSEGERAALLHLPLFAAVATAYDNARPGAPRIFALDEAFERIDDGMRAEVFRVIADLDLDVLMANYSMMPTYDTVSGIAINIMSMVLDTEGVGIIEMVWDGENLIDVEP